MLKDVQNTISFGSANRNILAPKGQKRNFYFTSDTCKPVPGIYTPSSDCATLYNGILNNGVHTLVIQSAELFSDSLIDALNTNMSDYSSINATMNSYTMNELKTLQVSQIRQIFSYARTLSYNEAVSSVKDLYLARLVLLIVFLLFSAIMFVFYFYPLIYKLNEEQKRTISFLLLIPADVYVYFFVFLQAIEWRS